MMFMGVEVDIQKIGFGDFCTIEQKRYVGPNEFYSYKVVGRKKSNVWTDVPVDAKNEKETLHDHLDDVVTVVCNNLDDRTVHQFRVSDLASVRKAQAVLKSPVMAFDEWFKKRHEKTGLYEEALCGKDDATYIKHEMNKAFQAGRKEKQAVPEGFILVPIKNVKFFSHDGENYEVHDTLSGAKHEAKCAIQHYEDMLADQTTDPRSDGNFSQVGYGIVLAESGYSIDHVVTQKDVDKGDYSYEVGTEIMSLFLVEAQEQSHE